MPFPFVLSWSPVNKLYLSPSLKLMQATFPLLRFHHFPFSALTPSVPFTTSGRHGRWIAPWKLRLRWASLSPGQGKEKATQRHRSDLLVGLSRYGFRIIKRRLLEKTIDMVGNQQRTWINKQNNIANGGHTSLRVARKQKHSLCLQMIKLEYISTNIIEGKMVTLGSRKLADGKVTRS